MSASQDLSSRNPGPSGPGGCQQFSYYSGRVEGEAAREQGRSVDEVLAKYKIPYREADFRPMPRLDFPPEGTP